MNENGDQAWVVSDVDRWLEGSIIAEAVAAPQATNAGTVILTQKPDAATTMRTESAMSR